MRRFGRRINSLFSRIISMDETLSSRIQSLCGDLLRIICLGESQGECHADAVLVTADIYERGARA
jgi:hypothetical protein